MVLRVRCLTAQRLPESGNTDSEIIDRWLEIIWLTLWAGRIVAKMLPWPVGLVSSLLTNNSKKWKDMSRQLEIPATLFFWALSIEISFLPIMKHNHKDGNTTTRPWEVTLNKIIISCLVGAVLNFVEKIIIQLIAISFHLVRNYEPLTVLPTMLALHDIPIPCTGVV